MIILYSHPTTISGLHFSVCWIQNSLPGCQGPLIIMALPNLFCIDLIQVSHTNHTCIPLEKKVWKYQVSSLPSFDLLSRWTDLLFVCLFVFHSSSLNSTCLLSCGAISNSFMKTSPVCHSNWPLPCLTS